MSQVIGLASAIESTSGERLRIGSREGERAVSATTLDKSEIDGEGWRARRYCGNGRAVYVLLESICLNVSDVSDILRNSVAAKHCVTNSAPKIVNILSCSTRLSTSFDAREFTVTECGTCQKNFQKTSVCQIT